MQKRNFITDLKNIKTLADKIKTLNESLSFADEYDRGQYDDDEEEYEDFMKLVKELNESDIDVLSD